MNKVPAKKKFTISDVMDKAFVDIQTPTKKILKQAIGMVITGMSREKQVSNDLAEASGEILEIELDAFAIMRIKVIGGQVTIETVPTGKPRLTVEEKVRFLIEKAPEEECG
jgi:hypothetical protein